ncbi:hypothetical protein JOC54_000200 [Alkalihalobacillus xiaoxiensis]|uniref:Uncharacterized protein n=1 Tax=Shouchella xiaoxiensis TaxID=766895 RepID=A0ABS2SN66_9BACI|nr:hypothetical protein [Shouchella xiaoxiensis]
MKAKSKALLVIGLGFLVGALGYYLFLYVFIPNLMGPSH